MSLLLPVPITAEDWQDGPADAPITLLEYGDFQCGDCREAYHLLKSLRAQFAGRMRLVYRHLPLTDVHPHALDAARAAEAAGMQGKFWDMHDALFEGSSSLTQTELRQAAVEIGLDEREFTALLTDAQTAAAVRADVDGIRRTGIHHTPTFFLNNVQYTDLVALSALTAALEQAIARAGQ